MTKPKLLYQTMKFADVFLLETSAKNHLAVTLYFTQDLIFEEFNGNKHCLSTLGPLRNN